MNIIEANALAEATDTILREFDQEQLRKFTPCLFEKTAEAVRARKAEVEPG
jgi:hypothetical protein